MASFAPRFRTVVRRGSRPGLSGRRSGRAPRTSTGPGILNTAIRHREVAPSQSGVLARGARINDCPKIGGTPRTRKMASMRPAAAIGLQRLFPLVSGRAHGVASRPRRCHPYRVPELRTRRRHHRVAAAYSGLLRTRCSHQAGSPASSPILTREERARSAPPGTLPPVARSAGEPSQRRGGGRPIQDARVITVERTSWHRTDVAAMPSRRLPPPWSGIVRDVGHRSSVAAFRWR